MNKITYKNRILPIAIIILVLLSIVSCAEVNKAENDIIESQAMTTISAVTPNPTPEIEIPGEKIVDFDELHKENMDIVGWIEIPGTVIDYPIAQTYDNQYYLENSIRQDPDERGAIFFDCDTSSDLIDRNTVIYGHNNDNGTMFADLHKFEDEEFINNYRMIYIYTPEKKCTYKIFASYQRDDKRILWGVDYNDDEFYTSYIETFSKYTGVIDNYIDDVDVTVDDKIITLSTCVKNRSTKRYLVVGVLIDEVIY